MRQTSPQTSNRRFLRGDRVVTTRFSIAIVISLRSHMLLNNMRKNGAGEGIRTLDPNLGKVVLYP